MQYYQNNPDLNEDERQLIEINRAIRNHVILTRSCRPLPLSQSEAKGIELGSVNSGVIYANTSSCSVMIKDSSGLPAVIGPKSVDRRFSMFSRKSWMKEDMLYIIKFNQFDASGLVKDYCASPEEIAGDVINTYTALHNGITHGDSPHHEGLAHGFRKAINDEYKSIYDDMPTPVASFTVLEVPISFLSQDCSNYIQAADVVVAVLFYKEMSDGLYKELRYRGDFIHPSSSALTATQMHLLKSHRDDSSYFREVKVFDNKNLYKDSFVFVADYNGVYSLKVHYDKNVSGPTIVVTEKNKETGKIETQHIPLNEGEAIGVFMTLGDAQGHCPAYVKNVHEKIKTAEKMVSEAEHDKKVNELREKLNSVDRKEINNKKTESNDTYERMKTVAQLATAIAAIVAAIATIIRVVM